MKRLLTFLNQTDGGLKTKSLRAGIWVVLSSFVGAPLTFLRTILLARLLTPEIFGLWAICMMVIRGVDVFTQTGFGAALIHRKSDFHEAAHTAFTLSVIRGGVLMLISFFLAYYVAQFYANEILYPLIGVLSCSFLFSGFQNINTVLYQKELNFKNLVYLEQAQLLFGFVLIVTLAFFLRNIWALVVGHVLSVFVSSVLTFVIVPGKPVFQFNKRIALELFHYGKYITGLTIVVFATTEIDNAVIGKILGMEVLGFYVVAYTLANVPATHIAKVLSKIIFPAYSQIQDDLPALKQAFMLAIKYVALITIPLAVFFIVLAEDLILTLYGAKWLPAAEALMVLAIFGVLRAISSLNGYLYNAIGKTHIPFWFNLGKLVAIALTIIPVTSHFGIVGAAAVITVTLFCQYVFSLQVIARILQAPYLSLILPTIRYLVIGIVVGGGLFLLKSALFPAPSGASLITLFTVGTMFYALVCFRDLRELVFLYKDKPTPKSGISVQPPC